VRRLAAADTDARGARVSWAPVVEWTSAARAGDVAPVVVGVVAFGVLFWTPFVTLVQDWWTQPEAAHGLLLAPLSLVLAWRRGRAPTARPQPHLGVALLIAAVAVRYASGLAAEYFTMRASLLLAAVALTVRWGGIRQVLHWWLPLVLLALSIPLPAVVLNSLAIPLQFKASRLGAAMLSSRHVPVLLRGNVIHLPGRDLFVTEACSGLRSLTALLALGTLIGGLWLRSPVLRLALVALSVPVAVFLNGVRIFLTGFLVFFVSPELGEGLMHYTEGWVIFVVAFAILGAMAWGFTALERVWAERRAAA
jgi:exosortase